MSAVHVSDPAAHQQPLELILARNLVSIVAVAAAVIDVDGRIVFYNDAAAAIVGARFEDTGPLTRDRWTAETGPFDDEGRPVPYDDLPLTVAVREGRPVHDRLRIRGERGLVHVELAALPLLGPAGYHGAVVVFWEIEDS
jgi:PAS domain-containing protein